MSTDALPSRSPTVDALSVGGLVATGAAIGVSVPFMRAATLHEVPPLLWLLVTTTIAALVLAATRVVRPTATPPITSRDVRLHALVGLFSIAVPNVLLFTATRALGAATASLAYLLPPVMTLALAFLTGIERADPRRAAGIAIGLVGAAAAVLPGRTLPAEVPWSAVASLFLVPLSIAIGNLLRSRLTPPGSDPVANALATTIAGVAWVAVAAIATRSTATAIPPRLLVTLAVPQGAAYALAMVLFFWLQRRAGVVFTAQVGYMATATGLIAAAVALGERLTPWAWAAIALIVIGAAAGRGAPPPSFTAPAASGRALGAARWRRRGGRRHPSRDGRAR